MKIYPVCENRAFQRAYKKGKKAAGKYIVVYVIKTSDKDAAKTANGKPVTRLGLTVTKGRGGAVVRNRIKRVLRAAWCGAAEKCAFSGGLDVIIVARDAAAEAKSSDILPELLSLSEKLGVTEANRNPES